MLKKIRQQVQTQVPANDPLFDHRVETAAMGRLLYPKATLSELGFGEEMWDRAKIALRGGVDLLIDLTSEEAPFYRFRFFRNLCILAATRIEYSEDGINLKFDTDIDNDYSQVQSMPEARSF